MLFLIEGRYRVLFCGSGSPDTMKSCQENNHIDGMERRKYKEGAEGKGPEARHEGVKDMNIGEFNLKNGRLLGWIATHTIDLPRLGLRSVESENDQAPVYEILAQNVSNRWVQIGALWEATSNKTGEIFLQGNIDDPSMPEPLPIALFGTREEGFNVAWRRPKRRDDFAPVTRSNGDSYRDERPRSAGGMGESTADDGGEYVGPDATQKLDDEIPF